MDAEARVDAVVLLGARERRRARRRSSSRRRSRASRPASRARARTSAASSPRCACVSIKSRRPRLRCAGRAAARRRCGSDGTRRAVADEIPVELDRLAERLEDLRGGLRQVRPQRDGDRPQAVGEVVEHLVELGCFRLVLRERPRRRVGDVAVEVADERPDAVDRAGDVEAVDVAAERDRAPLRSPRRSRSPSDGPPGIAPSRYLTIIAVVRESRLPRSFPSSRS